MGFLYGLLATIAMTLHVTKLARLALAERSYLPDQPSEAAARREPPIS